MNATFHAEFAKLAEKINIDHLLALKRHVSRRRWSDDALRGGNRAGAENSQAKCRSAPHLLPAIGLISSKRQMIPHRGESGGTEATCAEAQTASKKIKTAARMFFVDLLCELCGLCVRSAAEKLDRTVHAKLAKHAEKITLATARVLKSQTDEIRNPISEIPNQARIHPYLVFDGLAPSARYFAFNFVT